MDFYGEEQIWRNLGQLFALLRMHIVNAVADKMALVRFGKTKKIFQGTYDPAGLGSVYGLHWTIDMENMTASFESY